MYKLGMSCKIAVWESLIKGRGIFSGLFRIIEVRPSAGVRVNGALVVEWGGIGVGVGWRAKKRKEKKIGDLVLEQVWFPLDQRPGVGLFVQAERPKGEQRQLDVAPPNQAAIEGISAAVLHSLGLLSQSPFWIPPSHPPSWNKIQTSPSNCLRMFSVYVLFMRAVLWIPVRDLGHIVPETQPVGCMSSLDENTILCIIQFACI